MNERMMNACMGWGEDSLASLSVCGASEPASDLKGSLLDFDFDALTFKNNSLVENSYSVLFCSIASFLHVVYNVL